MGRVGSAGRPCGLPGGGWTCRKSGGDGDSGAGPAVDGPGARRWRLQRGGSGPLGGPVVCRAAGGLAGKAAATVTAGPGLRSTGRVLAGGDCSGAGRVRWAALLICRAAGGLAGKAAATVAAGPGLRSTGRVLAGGGCSGAGRVRCAALWSAGRRVVLPEKRRRRWQRGRACGRRVGCSPVAVAAGRVGSAGRPCGLPGGGSPDGERRAPRTARGPARDRRAGCSPVAAASGGRPPGGGYSSQHLRAEPVLHSPPEPASLQTDAARLGPSIANLWSQESAFRGHKFAIDAG
ncbi:hypothetical protein EKD16_02670 [Streptomonospora litoralis]|uniref:Uncharacterized protein n=1 Tax=Streptomonospora litoralis TaxID=2498135 RepID=A0A4P6PXD8_9ACTN|nr:hypothetical protein EKD16_02670 [Streptomonospora litoralis]